MTTQNPQTPGRIERILAYMVAGVVGLSILAFLAVIIGRATGMEAADFGAGVWPLVVMLPWFGLPIGFLLIIALLVTGLRRSREARQNGR
ncbi:MAG TPA: multidrug ABC transporter ATPase [Cryobacterium sp.]|nr:multidrug ABC transporter ATPase [Cryobacterium sp.]